MHYHGSTILHYHCTAYSHFSRIEDITLANILVGAPTRCFQSWTWSCATPRASEWRCKASFLSRSLLSPTEERYAQIEKEALAFTRACELFSDFVVGLLKFNTETDHKPLIPLFSTKHLEEFRLRMLRFNFNIVYVLGENLVIADTLSNGTTSAQ